MFAVPANSPHLRKSGSRPVVYDLGTFKLFNVLFSFLSLNMLLVSANIVFFFSFSLFLVFVFGFAETVVFSP